VTNEYYYPEGTEDNVVQWFEPSGENYKFVVYDNVYGGFIQYNEGDPGCPPREQAYFDQAEILNCGYKSDGYGMGGGD
jgi:hypothetical protein